MLKWLRRRVAVAGKAPALDEISLRRLWNKKVSDTTPAELLEMVRSEVDGAEGALVLLVRKAPNDRLTVDTYRANLTIEREFILLDYAKQRAIQRWTGS
jgi:hypothetical protein